MIENNDETIWSFVDLLFVKFYIPNNNTYKSDTLPSSI